MSHPTIPEGPAPTIRAWATKSNAPLLRWLEPAHLRRKLTSWFRWCRCRFREGVALTFLVEAHSFAEYSGEQKNEPRSHEDHEAISGHQLLFVLFVASWLIGFFEGAT